jgi:hypothetical protein
MTGERKVGGRWMEAPVKHVQQPGVPQPRRGPKRLPTPAEFYQEFTQRAEVREILERLAG